VAVKFESFAQANLFSLWSIFAIAVVLGAVISKTNFCTMGAMADVVNMRDWGRMRAWALAVAIAIIGVGVLEAVSMAAPDKAFPPYRSGQLALAENIFGGFAFGIGMSLAGGCANKCLVRIGGGNLKSVLVFLLIAPIAYFMIRPFPGTDQTLYSLLFYPWTRALTLNVGPSQDLGMLLAGSDGGPSMRIALAVVLGLVLLWFALGSSEFRKNRDNILGGLAVGLAVLLVWYVTSNALIEIDGEAYSPLQYGTDWDFFAESDQGKPADIASLAPQSFTFINPMGQAFGAATHLFESAYFTYGLMGLFGLVVGSLLWSLARRTFRLEWFRDRNDLARHVVGAVLMGVGGVLGMGCTIGQGVTGVSTLALGSFLTLMAILFGSALALKVQTYLVYYEGEASILAAVVSALVDLRLLPPRIRMLDAIQ
jgi:uncharacterized membrane protein YedE/YeeE